MGIRNYATASSAFVQELAASLTSEDVAALATELASTGLRGWVEWQIANEDEMLDYVAATPAQRMKKKRWCEPVLRRRLVLASIFHCQAAAALLGFLRDNEVALSPGGSYRDTTVNAGKLYWEIMGSEIPDWPEEWEQECPSPFA
jgi:hypothetical protein